jgi:SAM-dependent methyltransferase
MIERIAARAREEGLSDLVASVMDGHALDLEDDRFDVAASQFGVMLFPDLPRGLRELARVTRPGGRVLMVAYGPPAGVDFIGVFVQAIQAVVPGFTGLPADPPPLPFQAAEPAALTRELVGAGLRDVTLETIVETMEFRSGHQLWDWVVNSNPVGRILIADLTPAQRAGVRDALDGSLRARAGADGVAVLRAAINIALGTA